MWMGWGAAAMAAALCLCTTPAAAQSFAAIDRAVEAGVRQRVYPGAAIVVGTTDTVLRARGIGHLTWSARSGRPSPTATRWDLASLTKVLGPASVAARFVDRGLLDLDAPVSAWFDCFAAGERAAITVRMLLDHTSGLPPYLDLHRVAGSAERVPDVLCGTPLAFVPGTAMRYSDLNAILLGFVLERTGDAPLDELVRREVAEPLGLASLAYGVPADERRTAAPTSRAKGVVVRGVVHDRNAELLGGVAGHSGLFATASDVARFARAWLREGELDGVQWLSPATVRLFLAPSSVAGTRLLGWDTPARDAPEPSSFGTLASPAAYGHTGWTGTQLWLDPVRNLFVVFLTNRAYEPRGRRSLERMRDARARVADAAIAVAGATCVARVAGAC